MKQLGNLALVCANRSDVLLQIQRGTVCFSIGMGTQMETISLAWDDDEKSYSIGPGTEFWALSKHRKWRLYV